MNFEYDQQTFDDLEIIKHHSASGQSLFRLFNQTRTQGGAYFLKKMMKNPTTDLILLEKRVKLIDYFINKKTRLSVTERQIKFIEKYLDQGISVLRSNPIDIFYTQLREHINPSNDYYLLKTGCQNLAWMLKEISLDLDFESGSELFQENTSSIQALTEELQNELSNVTDSVISWRDLIKLDRLFRIKYLHQLRQLLQEIYFIDAFISIATVSTQQSFSLPSYSKSEKPQLSIIGLRHPFLVNAIPNDIEIDTSHNMCFLTGSNMAGKSTFLKAIGVALYLSHLGFPVPASTFRTSLYSGIITTINLSDNLTFGYSHFYTEVKRVKEAAIALAQGKQMFVIFDELFRGTNVKDAFEASTEIIKAFSQISRCIFFMSTHIVEIADEIKDKKSICFKYFDSDLVGGSLNYSYKLKTGVSNEKLGMYIVKKEGIFDLLKSVKDN